MVIFMNFITSVCAKKYLSADQSLTVISCNNLLIATYKQNILNFRNNNTNSFGTYYSLPFAPYFASPYPWRRAEKGALAKKGQPMRNNFMPRLVGIQNTEL